MNSEAKTFVRSMRRRATITRHRAISLRSSNSSIQLQNDDMKRLLLLLVPLVLADPGIAFDGGWYDKEEKPELSTDQSVTLTKYSEFHQRCMDIPNDHVGRSCRTNGGPSYSTLLLRINEA